MSLYYNYPLSSRPLVELYQRRISTCYPHIRQDFSEALTIEACGKMAEFIGPKVVDLIRYFDGVPDNDYNLSFSDMVYFTDCEVVRTPNVAAKSRIYDVFFSNLFAVIINGKVVSITCLESIKDHIDMWGAAKSHAEVLDIFLGVRATEILGKDKLSDTVIEDFVRIKQAMVKVLQGSPALGIRTALAKNVFKLNSMVSVEDKKYLCINSSWVSRLTEINKCLTEVFDTGNTSTLPVAFAINTTSISNYYRSNSAKNTFLFVNTDAFTVTGSGTFEYIETGTNFFSGMYESLQDSSDTDAEISSQISSQFHCKSDVRQSVSEYTTNKRYEIVTTEDKKLFYLVKTSTAREALKKTRITRVISSYTSLAANFIINTILYNHIDFGLANQKALASPFRLLPEFLAVYGRKLAKSHSDTYAQLLTELGKTKTETLSKTRLTGLKELVKHIYEMQKQPSIDTANAFIVKKSGFTAYYNQNANVAEIVQYAFGECLGIYSETVSPNTLTFEFHQYVLNFFDHARYKYIVQNNWKPADIVHRQLLTASDIRKYILHYYTINFIPDPGTLKELTDYANRATYWHGKSIEKIPLGMCLTISQDSLALIKEVKKCKTFSDISDWFEKSIVEVEPFIATMDALDQELW